MNTAKLKRRREVRREPHIAPPASSKLFTLPAPFNMGPSEPYSGPKGQDSLIAPFDITAEYANGKTIIKIKVTVGINSDLTISELDIYGGDAMLKPSQDKKMQKLYVVYDMQEGEMTQFTPYYLELEIPACIEDEHINTLDIYLWNEDPKTSRGTVTTVKHSKLTLEKS
ncbi:hypothetical protein RQM59_09320 [Flavobacteriaceae bacterium S356]|uniref:Uncharacterized protein n=1 Tax=Asprobacillus argus TaxID=3076534 RepID=A0ABU3LFS4_9FLAO|nr:hypothetical protein [Flavobacteriaceae bacterium S356]